MTATVILPDDFKLSEGEEFDLHAVAVNGALLVTRIIRTIPPTPKGPPTRQAGFAANWGRSMVKIEDPSDDWLT